MAASGLQTEATPKFPGWARFLVIVFAVGIAALSTVILTGSYGFASWQKTARDPINNQKIAASRFNLNELPPGFHYDLGFSLPGTDSLSISHKKDQTSFTLDKLRLPHKMNPDMLVKTLGEDPTQPAGLVEVKERGSMIVGGKTMPYIVGTLNLAANAQQFRGAYLTDDNNYITRFTGTRPGSSYDMTTTKQLLSAIQ